MPKNCDECLCSRSCNSYYGGSGCRFCKEINIKCAKENKNV